MRLLEPNVKFSPGHLNSKIPFFVFFCPESAAEGAGLVNPKHNRTPSYVVIWSDGSVPWPNETWADETVTSWRDSSLVPRKTVICYPCCDTEHPIQKHRKAGKKIDRISSVAHKERVDLHISKHKPPPKSILTNIFHAIKVYNKSISRSPGWPSLPLSPGFSEELRRASRCVDALLRQTR